MASTSCAGVGSPTTSAVVNPDGTLHGHQPHGEPGLLVAELDPAKATCLLASRLKTEH